MATTSIPYGKQSIDEEDIASVVDVLKGEWLTGGPTIEAFEREFADAVDSAHAVACSSGTAALHLAAMALEIGPSDKIVVPAVTFLASANAFLFEGAEIIFADVNPHTGLMTPDTLERAITEQGGSVRAVVPVHLGGRCEAPTAIQETAARYGAAVVEDASHALGTRYTAGTKTFSVGECSHSDMAIFSLHPVKTLTMGEGGVTTTQDPSLAESMRLMRNHGIDRNPSGFLNRTEGFSSNGEANPWYYEAHRIGSNYRASDLHCALGLSQLKKLAEFRNRRKQLAARYDAKLAPLSPVIQPVGAIEGCEPVLHLYAVHCDSEVLGVDRGAIMQFLSAQGIGTQVHYIPLHMQPCYRSWNKNLSLPGAEAYYRSTLSLPLFPALTNSEQDRIIDALTELVQNPERVSR